MKLWLAAASQGEREELARLAKTSVGALYQISSGARKPRPGKAGAIAKASAELNAKNGTLPVLYRTDLAAECAACPYAKRCLGDAATRADFPILAAEE
jgi:hypothetical protein